MPVPHLSTGRAQVRVYSLFGSGMTGAAGVPGKLSVIPNICKSKLSLKSSIWYPRRKIKGLIMSPCALPRANLKYSVFFLFSSFIQAVRFVLSNSNHFFILGPMLKKSKTFDKYWCPILSKAFRISRDKIAAVLFLILHSSMFLINCNRTS